MNAIRNVHALDLICSNQLMISHQNTHAFRPNSTGTFANLPINPRSVVGQRGPVATKRQSSQVLTTHMLRGTATSPSDSANHLEKEKSGYDPTNTCPLTSGETSVKICFSKTHDRDTMDHRANSEILLKLDGQSQQGAHGGLSPMVMVPDGACISSLSHSISKENWQEARFFPCLLQQNIYP